MRRTIVGVGILQILYNIVTVVLLTSLFGSSVVSGVRLSVLLVAKLEYFLRLLGYNKTKNENVLIHYRPHNII